MSSVGNTGPYARGAAHWRRAGWLGVLPVVGKDTSLPAGFTGHHEKWPSIDQITNWIQNRSSNNLAIRLPDNVLGIDVDSYHDGARQRIGDITIAEWEAHYGKLPLTFMSSARPKGSGSGIYLYQVPTGINWVSDLGSKSDVQIIRHAHRYMVTWPSVHPTGSTYQLYSPDGSLLIGEDVPQHLISIFRSDDLAPLPAAWIEGLTKAPHGAQDVAHGAAGAALASYQGPAAPASAGAPAAVQRHVPGGAHGAPESTSAVDPELMLFLGAPPGEQNNRLFAYVCSLRSRKLAKEEALVLASIAVSKMQDSRPEDPWEPDDVYAMVNRVWKTYGAGTTWEQRYGTVSDVQRSWAQQVVSNGNGTGNNDAQRTAQATEVVTDAVPHGVVDNDNILADDNDSARSNASAGGIDSSIVGDSVEVADVNDVNDARLPAAPQSQELPGIDINTVLPPRLRYPAVPTLLGPLIGGAYANIESIEDASDAGNAHRFSRIYKDTFRYVPEWKQWIYWHDDRRWVRDIGNTKVLHATLAVIDDIRATNAADTNTNEVERTGFRLWMQRSRNTKARTDMLKVAASIPELVVNEKELDSNPYLLAYENGVIELLPDVDPETHQAWRVRPARPEDHITYNTNLYFDPNATSKVWDTFLRTVLPTYETRAYLQALEGYSLQGGNPKRLWVILRGATTTGKTTYSESIAKALGDYCAATDHSIFVEVRGTKPRPDILNTFKRRRVMISETSNEMTLDASIVKRMTGNSSISVRGNFSNDFTKSSPDCTVFLDCNELPTIRGADEAIRKRTVTVPFKHRMDHISNKEKSARILECVTQLQALSRPAEGMYFEEPPEQIMSAILRWILEGWTLFRMGALDNFADTAPTEVMEETIDVHGSFMSISDLINDSFVLGPDKSESIGRIYAAYSIWANNNGIHARDRMTKRALGKELLNAGFTCEERKWFVVNSGKKKQVTLWRGLCLNDEARENVVSQSWAMGVDI